jgi:NAD(P)-dependent dehydrogenase (short-subunit alcohol dehydrogenase family)
MRFTGREISPGQVVVVTGASAGVGRATAVAFAERGARVALVARGKSGLEGALAEIDRLGGQAKAFEADMADAEQAENVARDVEASLGAIDIWVNDAFTSVFAPFMEIEPEEFKRVTEVDYLGYVYGTRAALKRMTRRDKGTIVQVGSALAYRGIPLQSAYCGAKHAIQGFHEALRCELLHDKSNVRVTMVQLPAVNTPQFDWVVSRLDKPAQPVPPIYQPEVAAKAIVYAAAHPERREYWVGGSTVGTLMANAVAPGLLDRYLAKTGYKSQQVDRPAPTDKGNLWEPVDDAHGHDHTAHGSFDDRSKDRSVQVWASQNHGLLAVAAGGLAALATAAAFGRRR